MNGVSDKHVIEIVDVPKGDLRNRNVVLSLDARIRSAVNDIDDRLWDEFGRELRGLMARNLTDSVFYDGDPGIHKEKFDEIMERYNLALENL